MEAFVNLASLVLVLVIVCVFAEMFGKDQNGQGRAGCLRRVYVWTTYSLIHTFCSAFIYKERYKCIIQKHTMELVIVMVTTK